MPSTIRQVFLIVSKFFFYLWDCLDQVILSSRPKCIILINSASIFIQFRVSGFKSVLCAMENTIRTRNKRIAVERVKHRAIRSKPIEVPTATKGWKAEVVFLCTKPLHTTFVTQNRCKRCLYVHFTRLGFRCRRTIF